MPLHALGCVADILPGMHRYSLHIGVLFLEKLGEFFPQLRNKNLGIGCRQRSFICGMNRQTGKVKKEGESTPGRGLGGGVPLERGRKHTNFGRFMDLILP